VAGDLGSACAQGGTVTRPTLDECFVELERVRVGFEGSDGQRLHLLNDRQLHALARVLRIARLATEKSESVQLDPRSR